MPQPERAGRSVGIQNINYLWSALMAIATSSAKALSQDIIQRILVQPLEKRSVWLSSGVRIFDTDGSPIRVPRQAAGTAIDFTGENTQIPEADYNYDNEVELLPSSMKSVKVLTRWSNELGRSSVIDLGNALQDRLVTDVAAAIDNAFTNGTAANTPIGALAGTAFSTATTTAGTAVGKPNVDDLYDALGAALSADVDPDGLRWMMHSRDLISLHKLRAGGSTATDGAYLLQPDPTSPAQFRLLGYPVILNQRIPTNGGTATNESTIMLADFSQIAVARDLDAQVTVLPERFADFDQTAIRVVARYDMKPLNPAAIVYLKNVTA
jgi:HK97 family phage major capsid protein